MQKTNDTMFSISLYSSKTRTLKLTDRDKLLAFEKYYCRWMLRRRWPQGTKNIDIMNTLNNSENFVQVIVRRKLAMFIHITGMDVSRKVKSVMIGIMKEINKRRPYRK